VQEKVVPEKEDSKIDQCRETGEALGLGIGTRPGVWLYLRGSGWSWFWGAHPEPTCHNSSIWTEIASCM
jgi:hypothetical protein